MSTTIDYQPVKRPIGERINFRMLTIIVVFSLLVGIPVYKFVKTQLNHGIEHDGDLDRVDLKSLGNFHFDDVNGSINDIPPDFRALDGKRVALEGFIWAGSGAGDKVNSFQFVYNIQKCCFGGPPLVQERVFAFVPHGGTVDYLPDEIRAIGKLHVVLNKDHDTGKIVTVYTMDVEKTEPL
jgi:hypothetical protein